MPYNKLNKVLTKYVLVNDKDPDSWLDMAEIPNRLVATVGYHIEKWIYDRYQYGDILIARVNITRD